MAHLTSLITAGFALALAGDLFLAPGALDPRANVASASDNASVSASQSPAGPTVTINRSRKSDRLASAHVSTVSDIDIAKVEFMPGGAIILRNRAGGTLFGIDPEARQTTVAKNVALPQLTIDSRAAPARKPTEAVGAAKPADIPKPQLRPSIVTPSIVTPQTVRSTIGSERKPAQSRPSGCDPAFSPITAPQLGHIFGRCVTSLDAPIKLAMAQ
jgi:hypothetical protein